MRSSQIRKHDRSIDRSSVGRSVSAEKSIGEKRTYEAGEEGADPGADVRGLDGVEGREVEVGEERVAAAVVGVRHGGGAEGAERGGGGEDGEE